MTNSKKTRALNAFAAMSRIPDDYVLAAERMLQEAEAGISRPQKPMGGFRRFLNSGWGAAVISGIVALAVLAFIIHAGVNPPATYEPPVKPAGSTIEMSTEGVNYTIATELEHYPKGATDITAVLTGKAKGESISTAGGGWHLERLTADRAEVVEIIYPCIAQMHEPHRDEYATLVCSMTALTPLASGTYRLHATKHDGEKYVSVAWCEFTVGSELYPPETENSPYTLSVPNTTYGSVNITVTVTAKEKGEALPAIGRGWKVVKLAGPANTGNTGITILEYGVEAVDPPGADSYATYTESLILEDPSAWLPGIYRLHDLNSKGESVAHCDFVIYEEGYVPLTTEDPDHIVVPGIFLWANNTPMIVLMDYYDELYPEPNPSYAAVAVMYPILLVNDQRDGGSGMDLHSGSIVEVEIGKKITYPHHGDLYALRVVTEGTLNDVNPDWLILLQEAGYTIRDTADTESAWDKDFQSMLDNYTNEPYRSLYELNGETYGRIVSSSDSWEDAVRVCTRHFTDERYPQAINTVVDCTVIYESDILYGIHVQWEVTNHGTFNGRYEENVISFKKNIADITARNAVYDDTESFRINTHREDQIEQIILYLYHNKYRSHSILEHKMSYTDREYRVTIYAFDVIYGDWSVQNEYRLFMNTITVNKETGNVTFQEPIISDTIYQ